MELYVGEMRPNFVQNAAGSRSTDEVTNSLLSSQGRAAIQQLWKAMEDGHKKAIFASSLIKNVISKKIQFEQERRMERGEVGEPSLNLTRQHSDSCRGNTHRLRSGLSDSAPAVLCLNVLSNTVGSGLSDTRSNSAATEKDFKPLHGVGIATEKGILGAPKSSLPQNQNSTFRSCKNEEVQFQQGHETDRTAEQPLPSHEQRDAEGVQFSASGSKQTKMSHLFVSSIQQLSRDAEARKPPENMSSLQKEHGCTMKVCSDNSVNINDSRITARSNLPVIKINLRSIGDNNTEHLAVSKLSAPNIGCSSSRTDDSKCQLLTAALRGESSDKVPHFVVRDIRDNKGKPQTPIHQVRDVRKLVKSSYHIVSLDNTKSKSNTASAEIQPYQSSEKPNEKLNPASPIVIKCQSVNTNSNEKPQGNVGLTIPEALDTIKLSDRGTPQTAASTALLGFPDTEKRILMTTESKIASKRQEKTPDIPHKKLEMKMSNQVALEKLQAAVKTMEELYVFEKNEWRRKNEFQQATESHVLSMVACEMDRRDVQVSDVDRSSSITVTSSIDNMPNPVGKDTVNVLQISKHCDERTFASSTISSRSLCNPSYCLQPSSSSTIPSRGASKSTSVPVSLKTRKTEQKPDEAKSREGDTFSEEYFNKSADNDNYLTIPSRSNTKQAKSVEKSSVYTFATQSHPTTPPDHTGSWMRNQEGLNQMLSSLATETNPSECPSATICHSLPLPMSISQPQVYCFSPGVTPAPSTFPAIGRKMLLDPSTGNYYLMDTPLQATTKHLFDPETGQYVDVPMMPSQMAMAPMPISQLALSPVPTYMMYPSFMAAPTVIPARTLIPSQLMMPSEAGSKEELPVQQAEGLYPESPFYMTTGRTSYVSPGTPQQTSRGPEDFPIVNHPVISISSQQGARIVAPPSFDGTTMSFVVEHR